MKQNRSAAQSESSSQFPPHSGKRQSGLFPKKFNTPAHETDVVHSGKDGSAEIDGAAEIDGGDDGAAEIDGTIVGVIDGVDDGEDEGKGLDEGAGEIVGVIDGDVDGTADVHPIPNCALDSYHL